MIRVGVLIGSSVKLQFVGLDQLRKIDRDRFCHSDGVCHSEPLHIDSFGNRLDPSSPDFEAQPKTQLVAF